MKLSMAKNVRWKEPFVNGNQTQFKRHPHREAHAYTLLYAHNVANKAYWPREKELFTDAIKTPTGGILTVEVPSQEEMTVRSREPKSDIELTLDMLETKMEEVTLETLNYKWEKRQVKVTVESDSPYSQESEYTLRKDVLLPPFALSLAFKQLDELAGSLDFLAEPKEELATWGFREVEEEDET